jgi:hypothetical protein
MKNESKGDKTLLAKNIGLRNSFIHYRAEFL